MTGRSRRARPRATTEACRRSPARRADLRGDFDAVTVACGAWWRSRVWRLGVRRAAVDHVLVLIFCSQAAVPQPGGLCEGVCAVGHDPCCWARLPGCPLGPGPSVWARTRSVGVASAGHRAEEA